MPSSIFFASHNISFQNPSNGDFKLLQRTENLAFPPFYPHSKWAHSKAILFFYSIQYFMCILQRTLDFFFKRRTLYAVFCCGA